jgi:hypothetical protein
MDTEETSGNWTLEPSVPQSKILGHWIMFCLLIYVASAQVIITVAGNGVLGTGGDGIPATSSAFRNPRGVGTDSQGNIYIADATNHRIRRVFVNGTVATIAGTGTAGYGGDRGLARLATLSNPRGVFVDPSSGDILIADSDNNRVRRIFGNGTIVTVTGSATLGFAGDGSAAVNALLRNPFAVFVDQPGNIFFVDYNNHCIRRVFTNGTITTVAGTGGSNSFSGDGGLATLARMSFPTAVFVDSSGVMYIADAGNHRVRRVLVNGIISTIAGGVIGYSGDGGSAIGAAFRFPTHVVVDSLGNMFISDRDNHCIRRVFVNGTITTIVGTGTAGYGGDRGIASQGILSSPRGMHIDGFGNIFIAEFDGNRVRKLIYDAIGTVSSNICTIKSSKATNYCIF